MTVEASILRRPVAVRWTCWALVFGATVAAGRSHLATAQVVAQPMQPMGQALQVTSGPRGMTPILVANGSQITLPASQTSGIAGFSRQSGLQLSVDASWPGQYGYRSMAFTLRSRKPLTADTRITIEFSAGDWVPPRGKGINVEQTFVFPAGATAVTERVLVPSYQNLQFATWRIEVDGRSDDFLAVDQLHLGGFTVNQGGLGVVGVGLTPEQQSQCTVALQTASQGAAVLIKDVAGKDLPADWMGLSTVDVLVMPAKQLADLAEDHPQQLEAMLRWVRAGGNLWLLEGGRRWQKLPAVERALGIETDEAPSEAPSSELTDAAIVQRGWVIAPVGERSTEPSQGALALAGFDTGEPKAWKGLLSAVVPGVADSNSARWFVVRGIGLGVVTAFRRELPNADDATVGTFQSLLTQSLVGPRINWSSRHGNLPDASNEDFNNLLIPGVGVAPVGQFQFLITLFALAIGPLNYWLLKRKNKLPLLLATVPVAAAATTFVLFLYGMLVDGVEVRARSRTLTLLDQRTGEAVSWGRLSYYAGIAPRDGLVAPRDQLMYPILPNWSSNRYGGRAASSPRYITWEGDQRLTRGWLASRTPTQYQTVAARPSSKRLDLRVTGDGLRISNRLGVDVTHVAVEDHDGRFYWCENLPRDAGRIVKSTDQANLARGIRQLFTANIPEAPGGDEVRYGAVYGYSLSQSIMEGRLEAINDPAIQSWGPGKYIAFTRHAVELDLGLDDVTEEASFHVIEGSW